MHFVFCPPSPSSSTCSVVRLACTSHFVYNASLENVGECQQANRKMRFLRGAKAHQFDGFPPDGRRVKYQRPAIILGQVTQQEYSIWDLVADLFVTEENASIGNEV